MSNGNNENLIAIFTLRYQFLDQYNTPIAQANVFCQEAFATLEYHENKAIICIDSEVVYEDPYYDTNNIQGHGILFNVGVMMQVADEVIYRPFLDTFLIPPPKIWGLTVPLIGSLKLVRHPNDKLIKGEMYNVLKPIPKFHKIHLEIPAEHYNEWNDNVYFLKKQTENGPARVEIEKF